MRFDHVGVLVPDLEQAKAFARDVLGLGEPVAEFEAPEHGLAGSFFGLDTGRLELFTLEEAGDRLPAGQQAAVDHFAVKVADLAAERERLEAHGVTFTGPAGHPADDPIEVRGGRHLWTAPETSGGYRIQFTEDPSLAEG
jgi:catechol 2,3-dioxygenase-like lactoylglutathione lyase family enzyme